MQGGVTYFSPLSAAALSAPKAPEKQKEDVLQFDTRGLLFFMKNKEARRRRRRRKMFLHVPNMFTGPVLPFLEDCFHNPARYDINEGRFMLHGDPTPARPLVCHRQTLFIPQSSNRFAFYRHEVTFALDGSCWGSSTCEDEILDCNRALN